MSAGKKVKIVTYGCQMNVYDSHIMLQSLAQLGYAETSKNEDADIVILNTCSVREKPVQKVYSALGRLRRYKKRKPEMLLIVAGCVAQQEQQAMAARVPFVNIVMGPDHIGEVGELIETALRTGKQVVATRFEETPERVFTRPSPSMVGRVSAFVTIMKGCNQFCSYCIVPYTRGRELSKPPEVVLEEAEALVESGVREVFLLGQNVNRYGLDQPGYPRFHQLIETLAATPLLKRIRFITSHPADCTDELLDCFTRVDKLQSFFHLPLQSGSDRILRQMNRRYDFAHYRGRVQALRDLRPDCHVSTDLIVGFPGETDEDFQATLDAANELQWGSAFSFKYSPRPGTKAAKLPDDVSAVVKQERLVLLQEVLYGTMQASLAGHVGKVETVLVEGDSIRSDRPSGKGQVTGRSGTNYIVNVDVPGDASDFVGKLIDVRIVEALSHSLVGELLGDGASAQRARRHTKWPSK